ncbi:hypothetical protein AMAG_18730 [Allomyces macrogynus ATCC 38327]|uniref:Uncharacterized protein n=1 Tax=Allomyces macrogynus (strain ATCC 38327) TaxID=578462 RepID=A0A0L0SF15_ALLM3|nr:hypothetical protein AMAG_18730 [Allomyces macrogynus ATCC 38327]|eukprot:KNE61032.1 hypothetical protein AMAG_18730 [Allomyces macrogynus ATCC 38327]
MQAATLGGARSELDEVKRMLRDTNPWLLGMTMGVSMLHSLYEFLAFKNEVRFWKGKKSVKGISLRSMLVNLGIQVIIFLYLLDNQTNTSYVILVSNGVGLAIEAWKVTRALNTRVDSSRKILGIFPTVSFSDKASYAKDVIFVVFIIQRYLYRVDHSRVNEFGQGGNGGEEEEED